MGIANRTDFIFFKAPFKYFAALVISFLVAYPVIRILINDIALMVIASESLSYRYFYSLRISQGQGHAIFIPQGHLITAFHHLVHIILTKVLNIPFNDLPTRFQWFGFLTLFANILIFSAAIFGAILSKYLKIVDKLIFAILTIFFVYGSRSCLSIAIFPDYYGFEASLSLVCLALALYFWKVPTVTLSLSKAISLGALAGVLLATKVSLVASILFPVLILFSRGNASWKEGLWWWFVFSISTFMVSFILLCAAYFFEFNNVFMFFKQMFLFGRNPGGEENFWINFLFPLSKSSDVQAAYAYALILLLVFIPVTLTATFIIIINQRVSKKLKASLLVFLCILGLHLLTLYMRPAGTTLWELCIFVSIYTVLVVAILEKSFVKFGLVGISFSVLLLEIIYSATINLPLSLPIPRFVDSTKKILEVHRILSMQQIPVSIIIPDNNYTTGTFEEGILKGMSDYPTWDIRGGQVLLKKIMPWFHFFRSADNLPKITTLMWIDVRGQKSLVDQFPHLRESINSMHANCQNWDITNAPWWPRTVWVCIPNKTIANVREFHH